jgi:hypothetical protein
MMVSSLLEQVAITRKSASCVMFLRCCLVCMKGVGKMYTWGVFDMPALEGLASEPGSGQPELGQERPVALFDVGVWFEPG